MFILRSILLPLQAKFSNSKLGQERANWFTQSLLAAIIPFSSSITANLLRTVQILFGLNVTQRRFYTFMASPKLPWQQLWHSLWGMIPEPQTDNRIMIALDDFINPKSGKKIFGCANFYDHSSKANQSKFQWAQNIVTIGLLKQIKGRWACLPLAARFYLQQKTIKNKVSKANQETEALPFQSKFTQATEMLEEVAKFFHDSTILVVTDSWFGNNGMLKPTRKAIGSRLHLLSRLRANIIVYDNPPPKIPGTSGRGFKYGKRLGSVSQLTSQYQDLASTYTVDTYGRRRTVNAFSKVLMLKTLKCPVRIVWVFHHSQWLALFTTDMTISIEQIIEFYAARWKIEAAFKELKQDIGSQRSQTRNMVAVKNHLQFCMMAMTITWIYASKLDANLKRRHRVNGRGSFAFSDVRRIIAKVVLSDGFSKALLKSGKPTQNTLASVLLRMIA